MLDVPTWVWQVVAAIGGGLGLGVALGALMQRGKKRKPRVAAATRPAAEAAARGGAARAAAEPGQSVDVPAGRPPETLSETPQQRLLERQREQTHQLASQLRSAEETHARELGARTQAYQAERLRSQRELEALRQSHAEELSHLMSVLVEQVDRIHQLHARHVRHLEAELARARAGKPPETPAEPLDTGPTGAMVAEAARLARPTVGSTGWAAPEDNPPAQAATPAQALSPPRGA